MIHITNFGSCGKDLERRADLNGFIPEPNDVLEDFRFPFEMNEEEFEQYKEEAWEMVQEASEALDEWRQQS